MKVGSVKTVKAGTVKVTSVKSKTVAFTKAKNKQTVTVPATVKMKDGKTYKVTQIKANAFKGKNIRTVTIGKKANVKGCLKGSRIKTIQVKLGSKSKTFVKKYKRFFTKANAGRKVTVK